MRGLIVLCFAAVAVAVPQYSYEQGSTGGIVGAGQGAGIDSGLGGLGGGAIGGGGLDGGAGSLGAPSGNAFLSQQQPITYNKQFYIHSAPNDEYDQDSASQINNLSTRRNLRVVFIQAPENKALENAALQLAKSASEDKTAIYVLNKQTDLNELQNKLNQIKDLNAAKPEVHFVKYRTPQEADHAQRTIQSQYDQFGGPSQVSNEGVAPVRSFVGSLGGSPGVFGGNTGGLGASSNSLPLATYLPPGSKFGASLGAGNFGAASNVLPSAAYLPPVFKRRY